MIALLLSMGTDLQATNGRKLTPFHMTANYGDEAAINVLVEHGANLEARSLQGYMPLHWLPPKTRSLLYGCYLIKGLRSEPSTTLLERWCSRLSLAQLLKAHWT